jgi:cation diffusion facilitator CzcD-associated flavoprotein CzcO
VSLTSTGATTAQVVPELAKVVKHLTVIQRSPGWVIPRHDQEIPAWKRALLKWIPPIRWRYRAEAMDLRESFLLAVTRADSSHAQLVREMNHKLMRDQLPNQSDMWEKLTPKYSPGCKRSIISDDYYPALGRDNVYLETNKIERITPKGIKFEGKPEEEFDLIITCTGFETFVSIRNKLFQGHGY